MSSPKDVTQLLNDWRNGNQEAFDKLMPLIYDELRRIAGRYMSRERPDHTLQATGLVHEAYMRLADEKDPNWQNRTHFFAAAALMMRRTLVNYAQARKAEKRGGLNLRLSIDEVGDLPEQGLDLVALDDALKNLSAVDKRKSKIIELRFFAGLTNEEIAEVLGVSVITIKREWRLAKAWLQCELKNEGL
jgi:RNA polymerase sigma factor (TIGR02999 family)